MIDQFKYSVPVFVAALILGCSDGNNVEEGPECAANASCSATVNTDSQASTGDDPQEAGLPEALYGTWVSACQSMGEGAAFLIREWTFSSVEIAVSTLSYDPDDSSCANQKEVESITHEATYLGESQSTSLGDAMKADMLALRYVSQDESGVVYDSNESGLPADIGNEYNIFLVSDGRLFGGLLSSGDATTPETRPTAIDEEYGLSRK